MIFKTTEKGQALIMIALAAVALFGFAALAIDGSRVFSDRRHSQNASDTSAFAAALARARGKSETEWKQAGLTRAQSNGYANNSETLVSIYTCDVWTNSSDNPNKPERCKGLPTDASKDNEYIYVRIRSIVHLTFARVIGRPEVTNWTDAVVHATPPVPTSWYGGQSIVSTMMGCPPPGYPHDPFTVTGHSGTVITNSGILVNSNCKFPDAYDQGGSSSVKTDKGVCVVGDADYDSGTVPAPTHSCNTVSPDTFVLPIDPQQFCTTDGTTTEISSKNYIATPGNYDDPFPTPSQAGTMKLQRGIYCLHAGINMNGTWDLRTDLDGNGHEPDEEGILFYVPAGDITFNGTSYYDLHALNSTVGGYPSGILNYLIYVPPTNANTIKITGGNGSTFIGTILAPSSYIVLNGGSGTVGLDTQIIGYAVTIEGNGILDINYHASNNGVTTTKPLLSPTK